MVGSVSDPVITDLISTVNDSAYWAGADLEQDGNADPQPPTTTVSHECATGTQLQKGAAADHLNPSESTNTAGGFKFAGLTKPPSLTQQTH